MEIIRAYKAYHETAGSSLTIGNFDGIHLGHKRILEAVVQTAAQARNRSMVVSFLPHPLTILHPAKAPQLITSATEKIDLIRQSGIDVLVLLEFNHELAHLSGEAFTRDILSSRLRAEHVFVGSNFLFGHKRSGDVALLQRLGQELDYSVHILPQVVVRRERVSSTWIRQLIQHGRISMANRLLGRFYTLRGTIVPGRGLGKKFLFPTLNLQAENDIFPKIGVYVTLAQFDNQQYPSVTNIGRCPTVDGQELVIETHLLNVDLPNPPAGMDLVFLHRLRAEKKFAGIEELRYQIERDCQRAWRFFRLFNRLHIAHAHLTLPSV